MQTINLNGATEFHDQNPFAKPLHADKNGRALLFALHPGQSIKEHNAPSSPIYIVIIKGQGVFSDDAGKEQTYGPGNLLIFNPKENYAVRALEELVFLSFLHGAPGY
jgi:quercetin dioxygenase-like cupin family protein